MMRFDGPAVVRFDPSDHTYWTTGGTRVPSVTGVIRAAGLMPVYPGSREALIRGTAVHAWTAARDRSSGLDPAVLDPVSDLPTLPRRDPKGRARGALLGRPTGLPGGLPEPSGPFGGLQGGPEASGGGLPGPLGACRSLQGASEGNPPARRPKVAPDGPEAPSAPGSPVTDSSPLTLPPAWTGYGDAWRRWSAWTRPIWLAIEQPVRGAELCVAGTPDRIGIVDGRLTVVDLKTGAPAPWHALQLAGYDLLYGARCARRLGIYLRPNGTFRVIEYDDPSDHDRFRLALDTWHDGDLVEDWWQD